MSMLNYFRNYSRIIKFKTKKKVLEYGTSSRNSILLGTASQYLCNGETDIEESGSCKEGMSMLNYFRNYSRIYKFKKPKRSKYIVWTSIFKTPNPVGKPLVNTCVTEKPT
jgi:hypothetical protein